MNLDCSLFGSPSRASSGYVPRRVLNTSSSQNNSMDQTASENDENIRQKGQKVLLILRNGGRRNLVEAFIPESEKSDSSEVSAIPHYQEATVVNRLQRGMASIKEDESLLLTQSNNEGTRPFVPRRPRGLSPHSWKVLANQQNRRQEDRLNYKSTEQMDPQISPQDNEGIGTRDVCTVIDNITRNKDREHSSYETQLCRIECRIERTYKRIAKLHSSFRSDIHNLDERLESLNRLVEQALTNGIDDPPEKARKQTEFSLRNTNFTLDAIGGSALLGVLCGLLASTASKKLMQENKSSDQEARRVPSTTGTAHKNTSTDRPLDSSLPLMFIAGMAHYHNSQSKTNNAEDPIGNLHLPKFPSGLPTNASSLSKHSAILPEGRATRARASYILPVSRLRTLCQQHMMERTSLRSTTAMPASDQVHQSVPKLKHLTPTKSSYYSEGRQRHLEDPFPWSPINIKTSFSGLRSPSEQRLENKERVSKGTSTDLVQSEAPLEAIKPDCVHSSVSYLEAETFSSEIQRLSLQESWNGLKPPSFPSTYQQLPKLRLRRTFSSLCVIEEEVSESEGKRHERRRVDFNDMVFNPFFGCNLDDLGDAMENDTGIRVPYPLYNLMYGAYISEEPYELLFKRPFRGLEELRTKWVSVNDSIPANRP